MPNPAFMFFSRRAVVYVALTIACCLWLVSSRSAAGEESLDRCGPSELRLYRALAEASEMAYDDAQPGLETTPSGCAALVREDRDGNLVIAFRGSMLGDRAPKHRFSNLGGAVVRRNYRDWVATNLKQATGFLPRQYTEAAALVEAHVLGHPADKQVFITGHSKGGGAATYAFVAACLSPKVSEKQADRMRCVTFNAAVVRERNWQRLYRTLGRDAGTTGKEPPAGSVRALCMRDDPVSKIASSEERAYVRRIIIAPTGAQSPNEQHGIGVIIDELARAHDESTARF